MNDSPTDDRFRAIVEAQSEFVALVQPDGRLCYVNPAFARQSGLAPAEMRGRSLFEFIAPADHESLRQHLAAVLHDGRPRIAHSRLHAAGGREVWVAWSHSTQREGGVPLVHSVGRDVSVEHHARRELERQSQILEAVAEAIPSTVVVVDGQGRYRFVNRAFETYCGRSRQQILGRTAMEVLGEDEVARRRPFMQRAYAGEAVDFTLDYPSASGTRWLSMSCLPLRVEGLLDGFVGVSKDVTEQRREEARLTHLAQRDPLTGLLNRAGFDAEIERLVRQGDGPHLALLYVDLDHFKPVNDTHGHAAGDLVLQLFAKRLAQSVRESDRVARLGGDEFAVLLVSVGAAVNARDVADKVLKAAQSRFEVEGQSVAIGASVGVAFGVAPGDSWRSLVARADAMLYQAKQAGRGRHAGAED